MELSSIENVLSAETMWELRRKGLSPRDYIVLERWATNSPNLLKELEKQGVDRLERILRFQSSVEIRALTQKSIVDVSDRTSEYEILASCGIETELEKILKKR